MKKYNFLILIFLNTILYGQENHIEVFKTNDPCYTMCPCDTNDNYVVFHKKKSVQIYNREDNDFYIDIPLGLEYNHTRYLYMLFESSFSDTGRCIVVSFYHEQNQEEPVFSYSPYIELNNEIVTSKIWWLSGKNIDADKYFGYYIFDKYFIYYYNVEQKDVELFNRSIRSIRNSCKNSNNHELEFTNKKIR